MKCVKCGYEFYDGDVCPWCGCKNSVTQSGTPSANAATSYSQTGNAGFASGDAAKVSIERNYSMKWYKVLLVILWFGIVTNFISGIMSLSGAVYQGFSEQVYEMLPSLKSVDVFSGFFAFAMTVYTFIVWLQLKNYKKNAPKLLIIMYAVNMIFVIVYMFALNSIISGAETKVIYGDTYIQCMYQYQEYLDLSALSFAPTDIISIVVGIVMIIINYNYFKKRSDLFIY